MSNQTCSHGTPFSQPCAACERSRWSPEQVADILESVGRKLARSATGYINLDKDDLRVLLDEVRNKPAQLERERALGRQQGIDEVISVVDLNMPYDSKGFSATIRLLFRRFTGELRKLREAGSVQAYVDMPSAGNYP